jgi:hypothetical protein
MGTLDLRLALVCSNCLDALNPLCETLRVGGSGAFAFAIACALRLRETRGARIAGARCEQIHIQNSQTYCIIECLALL